MICLLDASGRTLKSFVSFGEIGFHTQFGWVSPASAFRRFRARTHSGGFRRSQLGHPHEWECKIEVQSDQKGIRVKALENCQIVQKDQSWWIQTPRGEFQLVNREEPLVESSPDFLPAKEDTQRFAKALGLVLSAVLVAFLSQMLLSPIEKVEEEEKEAPPLKIEKKRRVVVVPMAHGLRKPPRTLTPQEKAQRAVNQKLGFLGLVGRKDLTQALGGVPLELKDVSAGAGPGGKKGSGGEILVGLGQGVKRTTVGNTGVAGLGGVGTKGKGGGAGGYGNIRVGSGEGKRLSAMPLSKDVVLEGGLDRSVIHATIAKYLNQIRACYEQGLSHQPGLNGQVTMSFEIAGSGRLNFARVSQSTLGNSGVEHCIVNRMMTWQFPKPLGNVAVRVKYPFLLRPVGS